MSQVVRRIAAVKARTGKSRSAIYKDIQDGTFPAPVRLGKRAVGWLESDITAWIESRPTARGAAAKPDELSPPETPRVGKSPWSKPAKAHMAVQRGIQGVSK